MMTEGQGFPTNFGEGYTSADTIKLYVEGSYGTSGLVRADGRSGPAWLSDVDCQQRRRPGPWIPFYPSFPGADAIASEDQYWTNT